MNESIKITLQMVQSYLTQRNALRLAGLRGENALMRQMMPFSKPAPSPAPGVPVVLEKKDPCKCGCGQMVFQTKFNRAVKPKVYFSDACRQRHFQHLKRQSRMAAMSAMAAVLVLFVTLSLSARDLTLIWAPSPDADVAGYKIYYGPASGTYTNSIDVGNTNQVRLDIPSGSYLAATAYAYADGTTNESDFSEEGYWSENRKLKIRIH